MIGAVLSMFLVAAAYLWVMEPVARSSAPVTALAWAAPMTGSVGTLDIRTTSVVVPLVAATPQPAEVAPSTGLMVVVSGRVSAVRGGPIAGVVVVFQRSDCTDCVRYSATTNLSGYYRVPLPEGRYRAGCVPFRVHASCFPVGASLDVTLDEPRSTVDFEMALVPSGRERQGVGGLQNAPLPVPLAVTRSPRPWIVTPFHR